MLLEQLLNVIPIDLVVCRARIRKLHGTLRVSLYSVAARLAFEFVLVLVSLMVVEEILVRHDAEVTVIRTRYPLLLLIPVDVFLMVDLRSS